MFPTVALSCSRRFAGLLRSQGKDWDSCWYVPRPRNRIASGPSIRSGDCLQTRRPAGRSALRMLSEIPDDHSEVHGIPHSPSRGSARLEPAARGRAERAEEQPVPAETLRWKVERETRREVLSVWLHPESSP